MIQKDSFLTTIHAGKLSHANLCVGTNGDISTLVGEIAAQYQISQFDQHIVAGEEGSTSVPIAAVRELRHAISQKPYSSSHHLIVLPQASSLTEEAQQALLKMLEEPPSPTIFLLAVPDERSLLPTIVSRCHLIQLGPLATTIDLPDELANFSRQSLVSLFQLADTLAKDPQLLATLDAWALTLRASLLTNPVQTRAAIDSILSAKLLLTTTQANKRLLLEDLLLHLKRVPNEAWALEMRGVPA